MSITLIYPNLGTLINYLGPLVPLDSLVLMGPHVPVTGMSGTLIEVKCHLLHVHALV